MKPQLSVILPTRNESMLFFTVKRLMETRQGVPLDVLVIDDGGGLEWAWPDIDQTDGFRVRDFNLSAPVGLCFCRDQGIEMAKAEACLILDAHANFWTDDNWAGKLVDYAEAHPRDLGCAISVCLAEDRMRMEDATGRYWGARIQVFDVTREGRSTIFPCKWDGRGKPDAQAGRAGEIQTILGGAYLLNRSWYLDGLARPWAHNRGWGTSEQTISIPNWLLGGRSVLLPIEIGHMYRTGKYSTVPYRTEFSHIFYNQLKLAWSTPVPDDLRQRLIAWVDRNPKARRFHGAIESLLRVCPFESYNRHLKANQVLTWGEYVERWNMDIEEGWVE